MNDDWRGTAVVAVTTIIVLPAGHFLDRAVGTSPWLVLLGLVLAVVINL